MIEKQLLTEVETAELLSIKRQTLTSWRCHGTNALPFVKIGRAVPPDVILSSSYSIQKGFNAQEALDGYAAMKALGSIGSGASIHAETRAEWCDLALQFGEEVIAKLD